MARHRIKLTVRIEEADHSLRLLKRLNQPIQQDAVETTIMPVDATLMVLVEGVHDPLPAAVPTAGIVAVFLGSQSWLPLVIPLSSTGHARAQGISRAEPLAS